ncbi:hypothetical protein Z949_1681 [Sulfitobacter guttiformis KCTC 32187]|nr:hypothetical protein Z949_1681 [Sulfitobacter guttiformis KCTC 32187]
MCGHEQAHISAITDAQILFALFRMTLFPASEKQGIHR